MLYRDFCRIVLSLASIVVIVVSCGTAFSGLDASGLWTDELFSAYFADPALETYWQVVSRSAEDVHPPGYYLLLWSALKVSGGEFTVTARALSAGLGVASVIVVYMAPVFPVGRTARLAATAFAVTCNVWVQYTQEARSYAMCFLLVAALVAVALRCLDGLRQGRTPRRSLAAVTGLSLILAATHYYAVFVCGAIFAGLVVNARTWRARGVVAVCGGVVLAGIVAFLTWHLPQVVQDTDDTWFDAGPVALLMEMFRGAHVFLDNPWSLAFLAAAAAAALWATGRAGARRSGAIVAGDDAMPGLVLLIVIYTGTLALAVLVTVTVKPMLSYRIVVILAPVAWIALAYGLHILGLVLAQPAIGRWERLTLSAALALLLLLSGQIVRERWQDVKAPWRGAAAVLQTMDGCVDARLPVVWFDQAYFGTDDPEWFHGHYLPPAPGREWIKLPRDALAAHLRSQKMDEVIADTAAGRRDCPVVLWSIHSHGGMTPDTVMGVLRSRLGTFDATVSFRRVTPSDRAFPDARLFMIERSDTAE